MKNSFRLVVFDWDGTLMDSEARIISCAQIAAAEVGLEARSVEAVRNIIGLALRESVSALYPGVDADTVERYVDRYRHHYMVASPVPSQLFPGALDLLERLRAGNYFLAIATGKGRRGLEQAMMEVGVQHYFDMTRCADETRSKPHPQMLLEIMDGLGMTSAETLMVGDTEYDMLMAKNAGVAALGVSYGVQTRDRLLECGPLTCVDSLPELDAWLSGLDIVI